MSVCVTSRWQGAKIGRGVPGIIAETMCDSIRQVTDGGERLARLHRVCYKFVAEFGLTTSAFHQFSCARN
jgi:hypothetical protein